MRVGSLRSLARGLPLFAAALAGCGGDSEAPLFGVSTGGTAGAAGLAGAAGTGGAAGTAQGGTSSAGAAGIGAAGKSGGAGTGGGAGAAGKGGGSAGSGGKAGAGAAPGGGAAGKGGGAAGKGGGAGVAGQGGSAGKAGASANAGAAGALGGSAGAGGEAGEAGAGGEAGQAGEGGASGEAGAGGATGGGAGEAGAGGATSPCGNGVIDPNEKCDGKELGGATCNSLLGGSTVGTLSCRADCSFDTSKCGVCGNGKIDPGEECEDGPDVAGGRCGNDCRIKCPDNGKAFGGHCYWREGAVRNWDNARKACEDKKGHLVTITSAEENAVVDGLVGGNFSAACWIGYGDGATEGTFAWVTGEATAYKGWDNNEPNDFANNEDCAQIGNDGKWADRGCFLTLPSICELDEPLKK